MEAEYSVDIHSHGSIIWNMSEIPPIIQVHIRYGFVNEDGGFEAVRAVLVQQGWRIVGEKSLHNGFQSAKVVPIETSEQWADRLRSR